MSADRPLSDAQERALIAIADEVGLVELSDPATRRVSLMDVRARFYDEHGYALSDTTVQILDRHGLVKLEPLGQLSITSEGWALLRSMGD